MKLFLSVYILLDMEDNFETLDSCPALNFIRKFKNNSLILVMQRYCDLKINAIFWTKKIVGCC